MTYRETLKARIAAATPHECRWAKRSLKQAKADVELLLAQLERMEAALAEHKRMWGTGHPETADVRLYEALASLRAVLDAEEK